MSQDKAERVSKELGGKNLVIIADKEFLHYSGTIGKEELKAMLKTIILDLEIESYAKDQSH